MKVKPQIRKRQDRVAGERERDGLQKETESMLVVGRHRYAIIFLVN